MDPNAGSGSDQAVTPARPSAPSCQPIAWRELINDFCWHRLFSIVAPPIVSVYGMLTTRTNHYTALFSVGYLILCGFGITAGYHRLWSHRSYNASRLLEYVLALLASANMQPSIYKWCYAHRIHHRYTDTDLDPYNARRGLWWSHIGWIFWHSSVRLGMPINMSDLDKNPVVMWQQRWYWPLAILMGYVVPILVAGLGWGDWRGGIFYAGFLRHTLSTQFTLSVNSLAHYLGEMTYDDKHTPRDHWITAILTNGEGYHNFHHQYPMDYRNAIKWHQWDPTKWFIFACEKVGLASHLKRFPENEIQKGALAMQLKKARALSDRLQWPPDSNELPVITWESFQEQAETRPLVLIAGFIHDLSAFLDEHPGGRRHLENNIGRDATSFFFGGVYDHSNAAHNLLSMMRVGVLHGGMEVQTEAEVLRSLAEGVIPLSPRLQGLRAY
ncbi:hypothetical protein BOTBODRAFT_154861 [Botryobasidium botryosum FD-172 SS1]|uniref:Acyl-CoA desaturase n=1 Tax=Botryobasidium botryosum (strain FD-172 SS1) TaxID=930990 RepID=A0A067N1A9_BOTB1|nr:hypothetical protein BOTBODRAFT_154861 [Botryobasidium botryosum FD-172 SS1]